MSLSFHYPKPILPNPPILTTRTFSPGFANKIKTGRNLFRLRPHFNDIALMYHTT